MTTGVSTMHQAHLQQIECLITLAEELHFGRTAERLGLSQSRVSQLIATLESRVGARLVARTSRRVTLSRVGAQFVTEVRPAYRGLQRTFDRARERAMRGALEELRIGFTGMIYEEVTATFRTLHDQLGVAVHTHDLPLGSPFTAVLDGEVDAAIVELPVHEPELTVGYRFAAQDQFIILGSDHPLAERQDLDFEDIADLDLLHRTGDAPGYWRAARTPPVTPNGLPILSTAGITSIQQGISLVASGQHAMLACRPLTEHHQRGDLRHLLVHGLEATSQLGLVWRTDHTTPALFALADLLGRANSMTSEEEASCETPQASPRPRPKKPTSHRDVDVHRAEGEAPFAEPSSPTSTPRTPCVEASHGTTSGP